MPEPSAPAFRRAVVALNGGSSDARIVGLVAGFARQIKAEVVAVHVVEIDWTLHLDADIAGRSEEVQRVLDVAESVAEDHKVRLDPVLLQARDVGAAIVDETVERGADLLVVVGTSAIVYPAASLPELALARGTIVIEVNPEPTPLSDNATITVRETASKALPTLLQRLPALLN